MSEALDSKNTCIPLGALHISCVQEHEKLFHLPFAERVQERKRLRLGGLRAMELLSWQRLTDLSAPIKIQNSEFKNNRMSAPLDFLKIFAGQLRQAGIRFATSQAGWK